MKPIDNLLLSINKNAPPRRGNVKRAVFFGTFEIITHTYAKIKNYFKRISAIKGHKVLYPLIAAQAREGLGWLGNNILVVAHNTQIVIGCSIQNRVQILFCD